MTGVRVHGRELCQRGNEFVTFAGDTMEGVRNLFATNYRCQCGRTFPRLIVRKRDRRAYLPEHTLPGVQTPAVPNIHRARVEGGSQLSPSEALAMIDDAVQRTEQLPPAAAKSRRRKEAREG
jgi:hypothetical protein